MKTSRYLIGLLLIAAIAQAQDRPSDDHYRTMITEFVDAMNSDDIAQRETCLRTHYLKADTASHRARWLGHLARFHAESGQATIESISVEYPEMVKAICRVDGKRSLSEWIELALYPSEDDPAKFFSMSVDMVRDPSFTLPERPLTDDEIAIYLNDYVEGMAKRDVFSGTVMVAKDNKPFFSGAWGYADLRWMISNKLDTKFNLGSMNKMFTGVAIGQLVEQGKLSFDDHIIDHLPDHPNQDVARRVTIHQLLTHTSGMASYWDAMDQMDWTKLRSVKDFAELTFDDSLSFEPGAQFQYSNSGPLFLGLIIEQVTGMDYHDFIREHVTGPAGMVNTDCYHNDHIVPNLAQGYFWDDASDAGRIANIFNHSARGSAAGGGFSTVEDLNRFATALKSGKLLSPEMLQTVTTQKTEVGPGFGYAYLFGDTQRNGHRVFGHGGGAAGINADLRIFPELGYTVAAMGNYDDGSSTITEFAMELITHHRPGPDAEE